MENISDRIKKIIENQGLSLHAFEKKIGAGNNVIGTSIKRNSHFSSGTLSKILNSHPDISPEWLLTGKGSMLRDTQPTTATPSLRDLPAISPCPELLAENTILKEEVAKLQHSIELKDHQINSLVGSIEHLTTYMNSLDKPLKNIPTHQKDFLEK